MKLEGLLVDLVPYGKRYLEQEHRWHNSEAWFWATAGDRMILSQAAVERRQQERAEWMEQRGSKSVWFGIQTKDGLPIGDIALTWVMPFSRVAMLGAAIGDSEYWGGGYGTDALLLIVDYAFDWLDFRKLWLGTMSLNERVMRQMEKVRFTLEARTRDGHYADGQPVDELYYGLLRREWPGREAMIEKLGLRARAKA
jgi:RimJ/RimL family protein N-acetyltransferase